jgi:hypothetical protein
MTIISFSLNSARITCFIFAHLHDIELLLTSCRISAESWMPLMQRAMNPRVISGS